MKKLYSSLIFGVVFCLASVTIKATPYFYMGAGASITLLSSWSTSSLIVTGSPTSFSNSTANTWNFFGANSLTLSTTWTLSANATVNFGDATNAFIFYMQGNIGIGTSTNSANQPQMNIKNNCTLVIGITQVFSVGKTNPNSGSTVIYDSGSPSSIAVIGTPYYNLVINNSIDINNASSLVISNSLTINSGKTLLVNSPIILNKVAGSGAFKGDNGGNSTMTFTGSGTNTISFQSGFQFITSLSSTGTGTIVLGSDLSIDGTNGGSGLVLSSGALNLNGHTLSFDNSPSVDISGGTIAGSSSSSLLFNSLNSLTGSLTMDATNNTLKVLYLNASGVTLTLANSLNITDSISAYTGTIATGGNLTIQATSTLKGRVAMMSSTGAISGNATVQIFARSSGQTTNWSEMGAGGVTGETIGSWDGQFPITCTGCTYGASDAGDFYSVQGYIENGAIYDTTVTSATPLTPGEGFWVYLGTNSGTSNAITTNNTGSLVQGNVSSFPLTWSGSGDASIDGYNLVANPYASPISLDKFMAANGGGSNLGSFIEIWNSQSSAPEDISSNYNIPAGQGFYVLVDQFASPMPYILTFTEDMKVSDSGNNQIQRTAQANTSGFKLNITGSNGDVDKTEFSFNSSATTGFDLRYDARKRFTTPGYAGTGPIYDHYTTISSRIQNNYFAVNGLPVLTNSLTIPIVARVSATGTYSISLSDVQNFSSCTILKDNLTGQYHDLATGPYACTINDTTQAARFELVVCEMNSTTSIKQLTATLGDVQVIEDNEGPLVTTHFAQSTKASISVFNVVGQPLISNLVVEGTDTKTRLNVNSHNEVLLIRVTTDQGTVNKKIITH